mmetsp:Transcript_15778/g.28824  ORF Transcript_15778/g.28824 Transcript_15778/m.28824 type:complete len:170 (-) Transcript_15778:309-818(-)
MLWLKLKLHMIPCISEEVTRVCELYGLLLEEASQGDRSKLKELILLQASIRGRIQELEDFFEQNFKDPRIQHFEKQRLRLRKLLQQRTSAESTPPKPPPRKSEKVPSPPQQGSPENPPQAKTERIEATPSVKRQLKTPDVAWNEIVFKIKLTPQEYNELMVLKAKKLTL